MPAYSYTGAVWRKVGPALLGSDPFEGPERNEIWSWDGTSWVLIHPEPVLAPVQNLRLDPSYIVNPTHSTAHVIWDTPLDPQPNETWIRLSGSTLIWTILPVDQLAATFSNLAAETTYTVEVLHAIRQGTTVRRSPIATLAFTTLANHPTLPELPDLDPSDPDIDIVLPPLPPDAEWEWELYATVDGGGVPLDIRPQAIPLFELGAPLGAVPVGWAMWNRALDPEEVLDVQTFWASDPPSAAVRSVFSDAVAVWDIAPGRTGIVSPASNPVESYEEFTGTAPGGGLRYPTLLRKILNSAPDHVGELDADLKFTDLSIGKIPANNRMWRPRDSEISDASRLTSNGTVTVRPGTAGAVSSNIWDLRVQVYWPWFQRQVAGGPMLNATTQGGTVYDHHPDIWWQWENDGDTRIRFYLKMIRNLTEQYDVSDWVTAPVEGDSALARRAWLRVQHNATTGTTNWFWSSDNQATWTPIGSYSNQGATDLVYRRQVAWILTPWISKIELRESFTTVSTIVRGFDYAASNMQWANWTAGYVVLNPYGSQVEFSQPRMFAFDKLRAFAYSDDVVLARIMTPSDDRLNPRTNDFTFAVALQLQSHLGSGSDQVLARNTKLSRASSQAGSFQVIYDASPPDPADARSISLYARLDDGSEIRVPSKVSTRSTNQNLPGSGTTNLPLHRSVWVRDGRNLLSYPQQTAAADSLVQLDGGSGPATSLVGNGTSPTGVLSIPVDAVPPGASSYQLKVRQVVDSVPGPWISQDFGTFTPAPDPCGDHLDPAWSQAPYDDAASIIPRFCGTRVRDVVSEQLVGKGFNFGGQTTTSGSRLGVKASSAVSSDTILSTSWILHPTTPTGITLSMWIRTPAIWGVTANKNLLIGNTNQPSLTISSSASSMLIRGHHSTLTLVALAGMIPGVWHHVALVCDGTIDVLYIDGAVNASGAPTGTPILDMTSTAIYGERDLEVGLVSIWGRALSLSEVTAVVGLGV